MRRNTEQLRDEIEALLDTYGVVDVCMALAKVCHEKADEVLVEEESEGSYRQWERRSRRFEKVAG